MYFGFGYIMIFSKRSLIIIRNVLLIQLSGIDNSNRSYICTPPDIFERHFALKAAAFKMYCCNKTLFRLLNILLLYKMNTYFLLLTLGGLR